MAKDQDHAPISCGGLAIFLGIIPQQAARMREELRDQLISAICSTVCKIISGPINSSGESPETELSADPELMNLGLAFDTCIPVVNGHLIVLLIDKNIHFSFIDRPSGTFDDDPTSPIPPRTPQKNRSTPSEFIRAVDRTLRHELSPSGGRVLNLLPTFSDYDFQDAFVWLTTKKITLTITADAFACLFGATSKHLRTRTYELRSTDVIKVLIPKERNNSEAIPKIFESKKTPSLLFVSIQGAVECLFEIESIIGDNLSVSIVDGAHKHAALAKLLCNNSKLIQRINTVFSAMGKNLLTMRGAPLLLERQSVYALHFVPADVPTPKLHVLATRYRQLVKMHSTDAIDDVGIPMRIDTVSRKVMRIMLCINELINDERLSEETHGRSTRRSNGKVDRHTFIHLCNLESPYNFRNSSTSPASCLFDIIRKRQTLAREESGLQNELSIRLYVIGDHYDGDARKKKLHPNFGDVNVYLPIWISSDQPRIF